MSNSNIDYLYPEFWAASFDSLDIGNYDLQNMVSRDVEPLVKDFGDSVTVPLTPDLGDADNWTPGDSISATNISQEKATVTLNKSKKKTINLNGTELSLSKYDLIEKYGIPMAKTILKAVNLDIYLALLSTDNFVDALTGLDEDDIVDAGTSLSNNEVSDMGRMLIAGPSDIGAMKKLDAFQHVNVSGSDEVMKYGRLMQKFGFSIHEQHIISKYTPADLVGAINFGAGYTTGDKTFVVNGFNDDTNPIRKGDIFTIATETGTPYHSVNSTVTTNDDTTSITAVNALVSAVANADAVNFTASRSLVAFVPSAIAFAARAYSKLPVADVKQMVIMVRGLPVRISIWHDAKLGVNVQYDILYGVTTVNKNRIARILTA